MRNSSRQRSCGVALAVLVLGLCVSPAWADQADLTFSVATDKPSYLPREDLFVLVTVTNTGETPITLYWPNTLQAYYLMDQYDSRYDAIWVDLPIQRIVEPGNSFTWTFKHFWNYYTPGLGQHTVKGFIDGYGSSPVETFTIVPEPVTINVLTLLALALVWRMKRNLRGRLRDRGRADRRSSPILSP